MNDTQICNLLQKIVDDREITQNVYYAGGTLCVDMKYGVMLINLNETYHNTYTEQTRLLSIPAVKLAFQVYEKTKGKTEHYKNNFKTSCIRHL